jgi:hypothetical protein
VHAFERVGDGDPGAFVAMDAAKHEYAPPVRVADPQRDDRPSGFGSAEEHLL